MKKPVNNILILVFSLLVGLSVWCVIFVKYDRKNGDKSYGGKAGVNATQNEIVPIQVTDSLNNNETTPKDNVHQNRTNNSTLFDPEELVSGDLQSFNVLRNGKRELILKEKGKESVLESATYYENPTYEQMISGYYSFTPISFSQKNNYLQYTLGGYESYSTRIYDVNLKKVVKEFSGLHSGNFNADETVYYICESNDFGGERAVATYSVPSFKIITDVTKFIPKDKYYGVYKCNADPAKGIIDFIITNDPASGEEADKDKYPGVIKVQVNMFTGQLIN